MKPRKTLEAFDKFLTHKSFSLEAIIIGGGALSLMGVISRETQDIDVLDPIVPQEITRLAQAFADQTNRLERSSLKKDWLNNGPESLRDSLPKDWRKRCVLIFSGQALTLYALGRPDFLKAKLFAFCDREQDRADCLALKPGHDELVEAMAWVQLQDQNEGWPAHVKASFRSLAKELGYEL